MTRTITAGDIDFSDAASSLVYSDTLRFILPVPKLKDGGEPLVPPPGGKAGDSFNDPAGHPIKGRGVVFFNPDDDCWQAATGDGSAVIIISPVSEVEGARLARKVARLTDSSKALTLEGLKGVIRYAIEDLHIRAAYNSTRAYVAEHMTPVGSGDGSGGGLHWRKAHDPCHAVFVSGDGLFRGPAATPQVFHGGAVILEQPGVDIRLVQPKSFEAMYCFPDGRPARVSDLKVQNPPDVGS